MNNATRLLKNTLLLALSTIMLRLFTLCFQAYLADKIGAEQLGLFGIISSVGVVFATVAISGVRFSVTRLVAEEESRGNLFPHSLMRSAFLYATFFGGVSGLTLYFGAEIFSRYWVMNETVAPALRIMAISMPFISFGAAAEGFFTAKQKIFRLVVTEIFAQLTRILFVIACFSRKTEFSVTGVLSFGMLISESVLAVCMLLLYITETAGKKETLSKKKSFFPVLTKTAVPLAVSAYMRTGLSSLGQIIIPHGLRRSGMGSASAFSTYGVIAQMSMPVLMFPAALLNALGEILIPRLTDAQVSGKKIGISYIVNRALRLGVVFSFGVAGAMFFYYDLLGREIYNSTEAGLYIMIFAPLIPIIYIDCVTDGCLKGLNQQVHSMMYNVMEGILNVTLLWLLLPRIAIIGYIAVMYIKEIFNAVLSLRRLSVVTSVDFRGWGIPATAISMFAAYVFGSIVFPDAGVWTAIPAYGVFYVMTLYIINGVSREDIKWILILIKGEKRVKTMNKI